MSLPTLTVVGATGTQGGSVVSAFLSEGSPTYHIRALTSNVSSDAAKRLANIPNVTVTHVDINSVDSLIEAFEDSTIIFANTIFSPEVCIEKGPCEAQELEERQGLNIAHAAAKTPSLKHLVWSSLPDTKTITDGEFIIPHFQSKIPAQKFMQDPANGLAQKSSFLYVGMYGNNIERPPYRPIYLEAVQKFIILIPCSAQTSMPFIADEALNIGLFAQAIFSQPEKTIGRFVLGSAETLTWQDYADAFTEALKKSGQHPKPQTTFVDCAQADFEKVWGVGGWEIAQMTEYYRKYGSASWGENVLTAADLGIEAKLGTTVDRIARIDTKWA